jgi:hypothetical protein
MSLVRRFLPIVSLALLTALAGCVYGPGYGYGYSYPAYPYSYPYYGYYGPPVVSGGVFVGGGWWGHPGWRGGYGGWWR